MSANVNNKVICANCRDYVTYHINFTDKTVSIKGKKVTYKELQAICDKCGNEVWVEEVDDINSNGPLIAYRCSQQAGGISDNTTSDNKTETPKPCMLQTNNKVENNPCKGCLHYVYGYCRGDE